MRNSCNADRRPVAVVLLGALILTGSLIWGCIAAAPPARADPAEDQFLSDLLTGRMAHPPLTPPALIKLGHQACSDIAGGVNPNTERDNLAGDLMLNKGIAASMADVGTLVHFALRDLCPNVPNTTGI
jgi:hypothetical protein